MSFIRSKSYVSGEFVLKFSILLNRTIYWNGCLKSVHFKPFGCVHLQFVHRWPFLKWSHSLRFKCVRCKSSQRNWISLPGLHSVANNWHHSTPFIHFENWRSNWSHFLVDFLWSKPFGRQNWPDHRLSLHLSCLSSFSSCKNCGWNQPQGTYFDDQSIGPTSQFEVFNCTIRFGERSLD